jgi:hypothetical protein
MPVWLREPCTRMDALPELYEVISLVVISDPHYLNGPRYGLKACPFTG